jgi:2-methylisocitrate lyase-like PEP mutase family enzyme
MDNARRLRTLLQQPEALVAPGVYDALTARLVEQAGFAAAYMTGAGTSAARGYPDYGLLTMSEMVDNASTIARTIGIPLIADADTGYGGFRHQDSGSRRCAARPGFPHHRAH